MLKEFKRTFGFEFEHISQISHGELGRLLQISGLPIDMSILGTSNHEYRGWEVKSDGSITTQGKYSYAIELTSPPITPKNYPDMIKALTNARKYGGVNASCGLHVHVYAPDLAIVLMGDRANQIWQKYISDAWLAVEDVMFSYMPTSRRSSNYCRPGVEWMTKYQAINFSPLRNRRTIEFRLHSATLNPRKALAWGMLCRNFVEAMSTKIINFDSKLDPVFRVATKPKLIKTRSGTEFYLQRDATGKWLIEHKKSKIESITLDDVFKESKRMLKLKGKDSLLAFQYPPHGNAMSELCHKVRLNGMVRGYLEARYDKMLALHGPSNITAQSVLLQDEEDFYHEPAYTPETNESLVF